MLAGTTSGHVAMRTALHPTSRSLVAATLVAAMALACTLAQADAPSEFDAAIAAHNAQDYARSIPALQQLVEQGDARAEEALSTAYFNGEWVARDYPTSLRLLRSSARKGIASAQSFLGTLYLDGFGDFIAPDEVRSLAWLFIAAEAGDGSAKLLARLRAMSTDPDTMSRARELAQRCRSTQFLDCGEPES